MAKKKQHDSDESLQDSINDVLNAEDSEQPDNGTEVKETSSADAEEEVVADTDEMSEEELAPSTKVKVGDTEYSIEELNALVEKGKLAKQVESEQNIDLAKVYPEFTKRSQLLKNPEALKGYLKDQYNVNLVEQEPQMSDEEKALKEQINYARKAGFLVKEDVESITKQVMEAIEMRELGKSVDSAVTKHKVDKIELIDFMSYLQTRDADAAAQKLVLYKQIASGKAPATTPNKTVPTKPEVLKTETKGTGARATPKERPIPHPDKDPEGYAKRILEFLEPKSPEES